MSGQTSSVDHAKLQASHILRPTLQDNDFLQSFVRIGLEDSVQETKRAGGTSGQKCSKSAKDNFALKLQTSKQDTDSRDGGSSGRRSRNEEVRTEKRSGEIFARPPAKGSVEWEIDQKKEMKGRRRHKNVTFRQEEVYTDKDRAAAVNMGSRDIIQSLKMKRRQDRNRELQIPDEAEPSAMLALAAREMRTGDVGIAIQCVNKVFILLSFIWLHSQ